MGLKPHAEKIAENLLINGCFISAISSMTNRSLAGDIKHKEVGGISSDWLLFFELAASGKVIYISEPLVAYRRHANNLSKLIDIKNSENIYNYVLKHYPAYKQSVYMGMAQMYSMYIIKYLFKRDVRMSFYCFKKTCLAVFLCPISLILITVKIIKESFKRLMLLSYTGTMAR